MVARKEATLNPMEDREKSRRTIFPPFLSRGIAPFGTVRSHNALCLGRSKSVQTRHDRAWDARSTRLASLCCTSCAAPWCAAPCSCGRHYSLGVERRYCTRAFAAASLSSGPVAEARAGNVGWLLTTRMSGRCVKSASSCRYPPRRRRRVPL